MRVPGAFSPNPRPAPALLLSDLPSLPRPLPSLTPAVTKTSQRISSKLRVGISVHKSLLSRVNYKALTEIDAMTAVHLPMSERVLDKLADILFATDEILDMIRIEERPPDATTVVVESSVQRVYDQVNELMKKLAD